MTVLINDPGGYIWQHIALGQHYAAIGAKLAVIYCASACLMLLDQVPKANICVYPQAWIGYHTAAQHNNPDGTCCTESTTTMRWERGSDMIARGYRSC